MRSIIKHLEKPGIDIDLDMNDEGKSYLKDHFFKLEDMNIRKGDPYIIPTRNI